MRRTVLSIIVPFLFAAAGLLTPTLSKASIQIDMVTVGNAGNAADSTGYGAVAYNYQIGKYEVTAGQYTAFLNAVAATDTYGLYNTWHVVRYGYGCKIQRSGFVGQLHVQRGGGLGQPSGELCVVGRRGAVCQLAAQRPTHRRQGLSTTEDGAYYLNGATSEPIDGGDAQGGRQVLAFPPRTNGTRRRITRTTA